MGDQSEQTGEENLGWGDVGKPRELEPQRDIGRAHRERTSGPAKTLDAEEAPRSITYRPVELEREILAIFDAKPGSGEGKELAFRRKEHELMALFDRMSVVDSMELHRRLSLGLAADPIALRFARLVVERRIRMMSFLAGARRREALRGPDSESKGVR